MMMIYTYVLKQGGRLHWIDYRGGKLGV